MTMFPRVKALSVLEHLSRRRARGFAITEAMIAMVIACVVGLGVSSVSVKVLTRQKDVEMFELAEKLEKEIFFTLSARADTAFAHAVTTIEPSATVGDPNLSIRDASRATADGIVDTELREFITLLQAEVTAALNSNTRTNPSHECNSGDPIASWLGSSCGRANFKVAFGPVGPFDNTKSVLPVTIKISWNDSGSAKSFSTTRDVGYPQRYIP